MDGLISLLILIGIFSSISKKKKQKAQKRAAQKQTPAVKPQQAKVPFTKEEWTAFLEDMEQEKKETKSLPAKASKPAKSVKAAKPAKAPDPVLLIAHDEPEGTVSTQGESAAEHAEHRQKILAEEARMQEVQQTLQELRHMNRQKLRQSVVMSEVLGKPVSLRPRGYR